MSKARANARRQQKQPKRNQGGGQRMWLWGAVLSVPLLIVVAFFYLLAGSSATSAVGTEGTLATTTDVTTAATVAAITDDGTSQTATKATSPKPTLPAGSADYCRRHPRFARQLGFNERSFLSTSAPSVKGLVMIQPQEVNSPEQVYQDPTWDDAGYLGHMTFDPGGNVYLFPAPRVSLVDNPPEQQNTLYRVDSDSAVMSPWITLTTDLAPSAANPFGLMGTTYDCDTQSLYASTVAGSTASQEIGKIVRIDVGSDAVVAELQGIDPFGLSVYNEANRDAASNSSAAEPAIVKRLYFGAARAPEVYSVALDINGDFAGQPQLELALPDPALKPWRIVWDVNGDLVIRAMPFDFNLIATSERIEIHFRFRRDASGLWQFVEG